MWTSSAPTRNLKLFRSRFLLLPRSLLPHRSPPSRLGRSRRCRLSADHSSQIAVLAALRQHEFNMRNAPLIPVRAPLGRRTYPLHSRTVIRNCPLHVQVVDIDVDPLLRREKVRVVECRLQQLAYWRRHPLLGEHQSIASFFHAPSLDPVQHPPCLLWRHPQVSHFRSKFHNGYCSWLPAPS